MSGVQIVFNDTEVTEAFNRLLKAGETSVLVLEEFADFVLSEVAEQFQNSRDPYGLLWEPSERARKESGKTLVKDGHLRDSFSQQTVGRDVWVGSDSKYAAIHQFGGKTGRRHATVLPPRPMLPEGDWPTLWEEEMVRLLKEHVEQAI